ncbi:cytochrome c oxidase assembly protein [Verminephrobacter eiseniae]|uniref:cytochrome c oxidase assembly protein n=1 Tax=Verminephrobacter eiseniae TaxID=364317 RepID=UPI0038B27016
MGLNRRRANAKMVGKLLVVAAGMFAFGYALIPIYRQICEVTGINILSLSERQVPGNGVAGKDARLPANTQVDRSRTITVEFDANARGPWNFKPAQRSVRVHPGELTTVMYEFQNVQDRRMAAQAIPSYAPRQAAAHFNKLECFCFNQYTLEPGEKRQWPVAFVIDPRLSRDVATITLSYTFFEVGGKIPPAPQGGNVLPQGGNAPPPSTAALLHPSAVVSGAGS